MFLFSDCVSPRSSGTDQGKSPHAYAKSTFRVSGFSLDPISIIAAPIMIFNASTNGTRSEMYDDDGLEVTLDKRFMAMSGDHEPIISPPL
jgi:hypothetical protein